MDKQIHAYYSAIKSNGITINAITQINLADIMKSKRNQSQKATYFMIQFIRNMKNREIHREQINGCLELGGREI